ncbi:uncharacterized protein LOC108086353 [Drosophila ficusphila]|uniref:uncharacterized protein LOC108086353 n=1 Tax=Drosophila ficusphila TaxID=30025 RepID=UPI001C89648C|nr:uncharacterized protein LOC108086353 [Drosophila ficusphila]
MRRGADPDLARPGRPICPAVDPPFPFPLAAAPRSGWPSEFGRGLPGDSCCTSNPLRVCCWTAPCRTSTPSPLPRGSSFCGIPQAGREGIATARLLICGSPASTCLRWT